MAHIEQVALARIVQDGDILPFINAGVTEEFFGHERWATVWPWVHSYWMKHGVVPPRPALLRQFPSWEFPETDEPVMAIIESLQQRHRHKLASEHLGVAVTKLAEGEVDATYDSIRTLLIEADIVTANAAITKSDDILGKLLVQLRNRTGMEGLTGIPTGFDSIDQATGGFQPEQLVTITALPKHGKSTVWWRMVRAAQESDEDVMAFSFEMSDIELLQRDLCFGAQVALETILRGKPNDDEQKRLDRYEEDVLDGLKPITIVHDTTAVLTLSGIAARVREHKPSIVFIDGAYMLQDESKEPQGTPRALTNITRGMKRLAQATKIPIVITTQSLIPKTSKRNGVSMDSIGYSSSFIQDSDVIIGLDRADLSQPQATLKIIAARNARGLSVELLMDYDIGIMEENGPGRPRSQRERGSLDDDMDGE